MCFVIFLIKECTLKWFLSCSFWNDGGHLNIWSEAPTVFLIPIIIFSFFYFKEMGLLPLPLTSPFPRVLTDLRNYSHLSHAFSISSLKTSHNVSKICSSIALHIYMGGGVKIPVTILQSRMIGPYLSLWTFFFKLSAKNNNNKTNKTRLFKNQIDFTFNT